MDGGGADAAALYNDANLRSMGVDDAEAIAEYCQLSREPKPQVIQMNTTDLTLS